LEVPTGQSGAVAVAITGVQVGDAVRPGDMQKRFEPECRYGPLT
jgi:hypothetical protein